MADNSSIETTFGVFTTDRELRVKVWDNVLVGFTGMSADEARGKRIQELFPELESRGLLKYLENVLANGAVEVLAPAFHRYFFSVPTRNPSRRFTTMRQRTTIAPVQEGSEIIGVIVTIEDVTERIDRERDLGEQLSGLSEDERIRFLEEINESESVDPIIYFEAISDENWRIRKTAIQGLARRPAPHAIEALLDLLKQDHRNLAVLNSALQVLTMVDVDTFSPLVGFLRDSDPDLRMQAALALGEQRDQRAVKPLVEALNDPDTNVRFHAIEGLGKLRAIDAAEALAEIAESQDFFLGFPALDALKQIGSSAVAPRLISLLSSETLREPAAETLAELGDENVVFPLAEMLNQPGAPTVVIAESLARLHDRFERDYGEGSYIADLTRQTVRASGAQQLLDALNDVSKKELASLARVIGWLRGASIEQALVQLLAEPAARSEVVEALVKHGPGVTDLLLQRLNSEDVDTRRAAVVALGRLGHKRATVPIAKLLISDPTLKVDAANALARLGDESALEELLSMIGDRDSSVRQAVVGAINSIGSSKLPERIEPLLHDPEPLVRESAATIAGYFGFESCASQLIECARDENERVRRAAVESLPFLEDERVNETLFSALKTDTSRVRAAAAHALGNLTDEESQTYLVEALSDDDSWVRYFAARALGSRKATETVAELGKKLSEEKLDHVRISILGALGELGGADAIRVIEQYVNDTNVEVGRFAASALDKAKGMDQKGQR